MKNLLQTSFLFFLFTLGAFGQHWIKVDNSSFRSSEGQRLTTPKKYESYKLDFDQFVTTLTKAPKRFESNEEGILIEWPMPDASLQQFRVKRSDVFHPDLAAKYPMISAYTGHSLTDPTAILKISVSHKGIEGMLLSNRHETVYLDRYLPKSKNQYILYRRSDYHRTLLEGEGGCTVEVPKDGYKGGGSSARFGDCQLRKFRLALACTGEYATFHGGNVPDVLAEYNASMVRVNGIYERDFTITMELIAETDQLIFLNGGTDPYTNNDGGDMLGQNQATIDQIIGFDNYDIGHVYSTGGGGIASLRSPCTTRKARGVTGLGNPTGDSFWVDYVAHEMGHQFGGNHTQNNPCNRNSSTAVEPGSASTIMGYAGICSPNIQNNSDDYFHSVSQAEVANFVVAGNGNCAEIITLDNNPPEIVSMPASGLVLPVLTPFMLTAEASDPDGDVITYCWEQIDNEIADMPPVAEAIGGPAFRSKDPIEDPTRIFPDLLPLLFGFTATEWEVLPNSDREMNFSLTVRDNNPLGGCTADEELSISFTTSAGPFAITSQNTSITWNAGDSQTITWDVANTDMAPVSCENVDILLSLDRGKNFDIVLAENVPNDGEHEIIVPFQLTSQGRIMLKCSSNIFFDINDRDINLIAPFAIDVSPLEISICANEMATFIIDYTVFGSDPVPVDLVVNGLPVGATYTFTPDQNNEDAEVVLVIDNLTNDLAGIYDLEIVATGEMISQTRNVQLTVSPVQNSIVEILSPADGQTGISNSPIISWVDQPGVNSFEVEVSQNPNFENLIFTEMVDNTFVNLNGLIPKTVYYWRVRGISPCLSPSWFGYQSFQTSGLECVETISQDTFVISSTETSMIESEIVVEGQGEINGLEVSLNINHIYVGDLSASLRAPNGVEIQLFNQPGVPDSNFGCDEQDIVVTFATDAPNSAEDFENSCNPMGPAIQGEFQPLESFTLLYGSPASGSWTLIITDSFENDGGELVSWSISTCESLPVDAGVILRNNILQLNNSLEGDITSTLLQIETANSSESKFTLRSIPENGVVQKWNETTELIETLEIGDEFTQEDIDLERVKYVLEFPEAEGDSFLFDTEDEMSRYTANNTFLITSSIMALSISAEILDQISCFGETDGRIEVMGIGGIPDYTYSFNGGPFESVSTFENLGPGDYTIIVKDNSGEEFSSQVLTIIEPAEITFVFFIGDNEISIGAEGGTGNYMYSLDGINYTASSTIEIFDGETYRVHVKDENGCISQANNDSVFYQISSAEIALTNVDCKGNATGSIVVNSVNGGLEPYLYQLNDDTPIDEGIFNNLTADTYTLRITDSSGSFTLIDIEIGEPEFELGISSMVLENTITLTGSGGTEEYLYSIDGTNFSDINVFSDLPDGVYTGYIVDSNGCEITETSIIVNTATSNPVLNKLDLFPNPALSDFTIGSEYSISFDFEIIDMTGKLILKNSGRSNEAISVAKLPTGLFLVKVKHKKSFKVFKLSKL